MVNRIGPQQSQDRKCSLGCRMERATSITHAHFVSCERTCGGHGNAEDNFTDGAARSGTGEASAWVTQKTTALGYLMRFLVYH